MRHVLIAIPGAPSAGAVAQLMKLAREQHVDGHPAQSAPPRHADSPFASNKTIAHGLYHLGLCHLAGVGMWTPTDLRAWTAAGLSMSDTSVRHIFLQTEEDGDAWTSRHRSLPVAAPAGVEVNSIMVDVDQPASITMVHMNDFDPAAMDECFKRNREGLLHNMTSHELCLAASYWGLRAGPDLQHEVDADSSLTKFVSAYSNGTEFGGDFERLCVSLWCEDHRKLRIKADRTAGFLDGGGSWSACTVVDQLQSQELVFKLPAETNGPAVLRVFQPPQDRGGRPTEQGPAAPWWEPLGAGAATEIGCLPPDERTVFEKKCAASPGVQSYFHQQNELYIYLMRAVSQATAQSCNAAGQIIATSHPPVPPTADVPVWQWRLAVRSGLTWAKPAAEPTEEAGSEPEVIDYDQRDLESAAVEVGWQDFSADWTMQIEEAHDNFLGRPSLAELGSTCCVDSGILTQQPRINLGLDKENMFEVDLGRKTMRSKKWSAAKQKEQMRTFERDGVSHAFEMQHLDFELRRNGCCCVQAEGNCSCGISVDPSRWASKYRPADIDEGIAALELADLLKQKLAYQEGGVSVSTSANE